MSLPDKVTDQINLKKKKKKSPILNIYVASIFIAFKKTIFFKDTKWLATNVHTAIACFSLFSKYNKTRRQL